MPEFKKMTKTEFTREANKAGVPPELYGAVLAGRFIGPDGEVAGGKVSGIVWLEDWTSEERYSYMRGEVHGDVPGVPGICRIEERSQVVPYRGIPYQPVCFEEDARVAGGVRKRRARCVIRLRNRFLYIT